MNTALFKGSFLDTFFNTLTSENQAENDTKQTLKMVVEWMNQDSIKLRTRLDLNLMDAAVI